MIRRKRRYALRHKRARKEKAIERNERSSKRTPQEQLNLLDHRLGRGIGATRERTKLIRKLHKGTK